MKVKNIPMADLSCSSPLPSADQVEIYVPHKQSTFQALCNIPNLPLTFFLSQCPLLSQIVIKECIDLEILQLSNEEQELGEECSLASTDHSSCLKTTVKKPDQITVDR